MGFVNPQWLIVAALTFTLVAPVAAGISAEPGSANLAAPTGVTIQGDASLAGQGAILLTDAAHVKDVALWGEAGRLDVVTVRVKVLDSPTGKIGFAPEASTRTIRDVAGPLALEPLPGYQLLARSNSSSATSQLLLQGTAARERALLNASGFHYSYKMNQSLPYFQKFDLPGPGVMVSSTFFPLDDMDARATGAMDVLAANVVIRGSTPNGTFTERIDQHREGLAGPDDLGIVWWVDVYSYATLAYSNATLVAKNQALTATIAFVGTTDLHINGVLECASCEGDISTPGRRVVANEEPLVLSGEFDLTPPVETDATGAFHVQGDFTQVQLRGTTVYLDPRLVVTGAATLTALALLIGTRFVRELTGRFAGSLYTRISSKDVLASAERTALLDAIAQQPGVHLRELQRRLGFGWGQLHYHLGVLRRSGFVATQRTGKHVQAFPQADDRRASDTLRVRGAALPVYEEAVKRGVVTFAELQATLGISRQLARYHVLQLVQAGFIEEVAGSPGSFAPKSTPEKRAEA